MTYTHTSIPVELTEQAFCDDCGNPLPAGTLARRRVTDTGRRGFNIEWLCAGACGPIIDVSDDTLMRKRIAELEQALQDTRDLLCAPFDHATDRLLAINDRIAQTMPYVPGGCREIEDDKARIKELEAECERLRASEETVRLLAEVIRVSDDTLMRKRIAELEERLAVSERRHRRALELAQQNQDEAMDLAEVLTVAERECDRLRELIAQVRQAVNVPGVQLTADPDWQVAAVRALLKEADQ